MNTNSPLALMTLAIAVGFFAIGGLMPSLDDKKTHKAQGQELDYADYTERSTAGQDNLTEGQDALQLRTFSLKPPTPTPTRTPTVATCTSNVAVNLLVDNSGSMDYGTKMRDLKIALNALGNNFPDSGVITFQTYSEETTERIRFEKLFGAIKPQYIQAVDSMVPLNFTYSKDAFIFAKSKLDAGRPKFPNHKFAMIFISDGIPETNETDNTCPGGITGPICGQHPIAPKGTCRCFASSQDPRAIAAQVKQSGVRIFTVAYIDDADQKFNTMLTNMMTEVASSPSDAYTAPTSDKVVGIIDQIRVKLCNE